MDKNLLLPRPSWSQKLVAWALAGSETASHQYHHQRKQTLLGHLTGRVVEIGPGTGINLVYYPPGIHWIGIEPNPAMYPHLQNRVKEWGGTAELHLGWVEKLPLPDESADVVVSTLVFCSVARPLQGMQEVYRVLKPNGRFVFMEHVAAPVGSRTRRLQDWLNPLWKRLADGCHLNRETAVLLQSVGFTSITCDSFASGHRFTLPHIMGVAVK